MLDLGRIFCAAGERKRFSLVSGAQFVAVIDTLRFTDCFSELFLRGFPFPDKGMDHLARLVSLNRSLHSIFLDECGFKKPHIADLSDALESRTWLNSLSLSRNKFGNDGVKILCRKLAAVKVCRICRRHPPSHCFQVPKHRNKTTTVKSLR
jgi:hypothetical protein